MAEFIILMTMTKKQSQYAKANQHPILFVVWALKLSNELTQLTSLDTGQLS